MRTPSTTATTSNISISNLLTGLLYVHQYSDIFSQCNLANCDFVLLSKIECPIEKDEESEGPNFRWEDMRYNAALCTPGDCYLLNVMLVQWTGDEVERVAVGSIHESAWIAIARDKKHIVLT